MEQEKTKGLFFIPMNKGVPIPERGMGQGEQTRVGAKSKRERPTMGEDTWKEEKVANRK